jgi:hypothetical protein
MDAIAVATKKQEVEECAFVKSKRMKNTSRGVYVYSEVMTHR